MQITFTNDFANGPRQFTAQEIADFLRDEQTAETMLETTFTNNISLTFNVGFGSIRGVTMANQNSAAAAPHALPQRGQPPVPRRAPFTGGIFFARRRRDEGGRSGGVGP